MNNGSDDHAHEQDEKQNSDFHQSVMEQDGFTIHHSKKKSDYPSSFTKLSGNAAQKKRARGGFKYKMAEKAKQAIQEETNSKLLIEKLKDSVQEYCSKMKEFSFCSFVLEMFGLFHKQRSMFEKVDLICYGIGDLFTSRIAQIQFSSLLILKQNFRESAGVEIVNCSVYDPIMLLNHGPQSINELNTFLNTEYGVSWPSANDECKYSCVRDTVFFMPHCSKQMYCNVISSNLNQLNQLFICGNNFSSYSMRKPSKLLALFEVEHSWNGRMGTKRRADKLKQLIFESFNDTAVHWTDKESAQISDIDIDNNDVELISNQQLDESLQELGS